MALRPCPDCNCQISSTARACPNCGYRSRRERTGSRPLLTAFVLFLAGYFSYQAWLAVHEPGTSPLEQFEARSRIPPPPVGAPTPAESNTTSPTPASAPSVPPVPYEEAQFVQIVRQSSTDYDAGANDMAKGATRPARAQKLCATGNRPTVQNWLGVINELSSNNAGKGVLSIRLDQHLTLATNNNDLSDAMGMTTLISPGTPLFQAVSQMKVGDTVIFSGSFASNEKDCFEEQSLTQEGSMQDPSFLFQFTDVRAIE